MESVHNPDKMLKELPKEILEEDIIPEKFLAGIQNFPSSDCRSPEYYISIISIN